jgi:hypothetical protein
MVASVPHVRASLPLAPGASIARDGLRMEIVSWSSSAGDATIELRTKTVAQNEEAPAIPGWTSAPTYALVNDARHEALPLSEGGEQSNQGWFVLPGTSTWSSTYSLRSVSPAPPRTARDESWFHNARLVVIEWVPLGSYPVSAEWAAP